MDRKPGKPDQTDRDRLKQIEQSDLAESRVNQDFVDWLKTKGPNYLLIILAALCVYMLIARWNQSKQQNQIEAWEALSTADLPRSKEDVAIEYDDVRGVPELAHITAARQYVQSIRANATIPSLMEQARLVANQQGFQPNVADVTEPLSAEQRAQNLIEAERHFQTVLDKVGDVDGDAEPGRLLLKVAGLNGLAAVAEADGDTKKAKELYEQSAAASESVFPELAKQARGRAASVDALADLGALPIGEGALVDSFQSSQPSVGKPMMPSLQRLIESEETPTTAAAAASGS